MDNQTQREKIEKLRELIKGIDIAMLTTIDENGNLRSRPMGTQEVEFDGDLWFLTSVDTVKVSEIERENRVNVSYGGGKDRYVSVSGTAVVLNDRAKIKELWSPIYKAYFPEGLDDPNLRLLKIEVQQAEYWHTPGGIVATIIAFAQAMAGKETEMGENEKLQLDNTATSG
ncbi:MAG: pyridoxamine 5'-phosphate oxidase family protein [Armatimonadetes bacterium]|nr:pyridoxamine 5'-phosphate oxidase family protein [Anaerolineae bacterium]